MGNSEAGQPTLLTKRKRPRGSPSGFRFLIFRALLLRLKYSYVKIYRAASQNNSREGLFSCNLKIKKADYNYPRILEYNC